jgi:histidinol-phosphate/aromatic aminotransferase/cobyric acid decarboxylase-like protein
MKLLVNKTERIDNIYSDVEYRTDNNVPVSKYMLSKLKDIDYFYYNYPDKSKIDTVLQNIMYIHNNNYIYGVGVDGIIKDIFCLYSNKNVYFDIPNYGMVDVYSSLFGCNRINDIENCDLVYISTPNPSLFEYKDLNELIDLIEFYSSVFFVIDYSYEIYPSGDIQTFFHKIEELISHKNCMVLYGTSKMLGLPCLRMGIGITNNKHIYSLLDSMKQPHPFTPYSIEVFCSVFKENIINNHVKIINESKLYFIDLHKKHIINETSGPYIFLDSDVGGCKKIDDYYRFSVIDRSLYGI